MKKLKMNKKKTDNFKKNFKNFTLWLSTAYVIANVYINCRRLIKSINDIDEAETFI